MPKGAAVIYFGSTLHGAGANMTSQIIRNSFHLSFCLGWLRTEENHYIATPFDLVPQLAPRTRQLLGFTTYKPKVMPAGLLGLKDCEDISPLFAPDHEVEPAE
jgi:ectoine hydroxylase-related dioxygenase (phytanoyl-CoA dioxygenase family)